MPRVEHALPALPGSGTLRELSPENLHQSARGHPPGQVGRNAIDQWIALSDAGNGQERFFDVSFPLAEKVVDFRHATAHLTALAKLLQPGPAGEALLSAWCHQLKHAGGTALLAELSSSNRHAKVDMLSPLSAVKLGHYPPL